MIFDLHYLIFVYFTPFLIFFGAIFVLLSRIFPDQKKASAVIAAGMSVLGVSYIITTGFAQSFFLSFIGKTVEIIGLGGVLVFLIGFLGIKMSTAIENTSVRMAILMIFSLIILWILHGTSLEKIASSMFGLLFFLSFLGFAYFLSKKMMKKH